MTEKTIEELRDDLAKAEVVEALAKARSDEARVWAEVVEADDDDADAARTRVKAWDRIWGRAWTEIKRIKDEIDKLEQYHENN